MNIRTTAMFFVLIGCGKDNAVAFGGDGEPTDLTTRNGDGDAGGDTGGSIGDPPEISSASGSWNSSNLLVDITVTDPDSDIDGGRVGITVDELEEQWFTIQDTETAGGEIDEAAYYRDRDEVSVTLQDMDSSGPTPIITVRVKDAQMNASEAVTVEVAD